MINTASEEMDSQLLYTKLTILLKTIYIQEPQQSTVLERSVIDYWGGGKGLKLVLLDPNLTLSQWFYPTKTITSHSGDQQKTFIMYFYYLHFY